MFLQKIGLLKILVIKVQKMDINLETMLEYALYLISSTILCVRKKVPLGKQLLIFTNPETKTWYVPFTQFSIFALPLQSLYLHYLQ
jgi:hypothetical protein